MTNSLKISLKEKISLVFFLLFFCLAVVQLFNPDPMRFYNSSKGIESEYKTLLIKKVQEEKKVYNEKIASLQKINDSLSQSAELTDQQLQQYRSKNASLRFQLQSTIVSYNSDTSLIKDEMAFDSLAGMSKQYMVIVQEQDSLCLLEISLLKGQMENRDSVIVLCDSQVKSLEQDFYLLSQSHERVSEQLSFTEKKLRRQTVKKRLWTGAALIISGVCVSFYLTHH